MGDRVRANGSPLGAFRRTRHARGARRRHRQPRRPRSDARGHVLEPTDLGDHGMFPAPLDEYPIHQAPISMRHVATSDRNFYDRCYFNAHDRTGDIFLVTGLGVYPNLGVVDAYATVRKGDHQWAIRCSDALEDRSIDVAVGPYRLEV